MKKILQFLTSSLMLLDLQCVRNMPQSYDTNNYYNIRLMTFTMCGVIYGVIVGSRIRVACNTLAKLCKL